MCVIIKYFVCIVFYSVYYYQEVIIVNVLLWSYYELYNSFSTIDHLAQNSA